MTNDPGNRLHVAIIMDGNGRWAAQRGLPRLEGHRRGAEAVRKVVEVAPDLGIGTLTLYAFSADNWKRPAAEVHGLMDLFERFLDGERQRSVENGVRVNVVGRRDRLRPAVLEGIEGIESATEKGDAIHLRIAVDYSSREAILQAAAAVGNGRPASRAEFSAALNREIHSSPASPDVDLLIRTSGEQRLSDFLLWECAYAEFLFSERLWPDFGEEDLRGAVEEFRGRNRRFGALPTRLELAS